MLNLLPRAFRDCERVTRRGFLQVGALAPLGVSLPLWLAGRARAASQGRQPSGDVNCILIWTHGGTSHIDTFDPKPEAPDNVRGEFKAIQTSVPGVLFGEVCPQLAKNAHRFGLLRGWNPRNASHGMADQWLMSGRRFNPAVHYPCYGAVVSFYKGFKSVLPPFVQLGTSLDKRFGGGSAGVLGIEHNPFVLDADPNAKKLNVRDISLPGGITPQRVARRRKMLQAIDQLQIQADRQPEAFEALDDYYKTAFAMITAPETKQAFQIEKEDPRLRDRYGRNRTGQSLLLARRLIEAGVRFVTVTNPGWDTHTNNFNTLKKYRMPPIDQGLSQLLVDLEQRGLLDNTLVVWLTDFGRTPKVNSASGRDHWGQSGFAIMAGAGVPGGSVIGATSEDGSSVVKDQYFTEHIAATVYHKLGIPLDLIVQAPDGRPIRLLEDEIEPIKQWV